MTTSVKWSINDYNLMIKSGVLNNRSVELIEGEILEVSPESPLHIIFPDVEVDIEKILTRQ